MRRHVVLGAVLVVLTSLAAGADEPAPPPGSWSGSLGLSYLSTTGNSDTRNAGLDLAVKRTPDPWGLEGSASFLRAEEGGSTTAERIRGRLRALRDISDRWSVFGGAIGERDTFAGFDLRAIAEAGARWAALKGSAHTLSFDAGLTWTHESLVSGPSQSYAGGVLGAAYGLSFGEHASLTEHAAFYPDFKTSDNWRIESETALQAAMTDRLALKLGYQVRYANRPVTGFTTTDTTTTVSVVLSF